MDALCRSRSVLDGCWVDQTTKEIELTEREENAGSGILKPDPPIIQD